MISRQRAILKEAIRAPDALSARYLPFFIGLNFPFLLLIDNMWRLSGHDQLRLVLAKATGFGVLFLYFLLIKNTFNARLRRLLSMPILLILSGIGGAIQGIVSGGLLELLELKTQFSIFDRSLTAFVVALTWLPINAVATSALSTFRKNRTEYLRRIEAIGRISFEQEGLAKKIRSQVEAEIIGELKWSREFARSKFKSSIEEGISSSAMSPQLIVEYANQDLRAISHKLWEQADTKSRVSTSVKTSEMDNYWLLYKMNYFLPPLNSSVQAFMILTLFLPLSLRGFPITVQLETAAIFSAVGFGTLKFGELLYKRLPKYGPIIIAFRTFSALIASCLTAILFSNEYILNVPNLPLPRLVGALIAFILIDVALAISKSILYSQEEQIEALFRSIGREKAQINLANLEIAMISRQWAQHIHGSLSSKLISTAAILESAVEHKDLAVKEAAINEVFQILSKDFAGPVIVKRELMQEIFHKVHQWNSVIDISIKSSEKLDFPTIPVERVGLAIEEALANAYRHGQATKVEILLRSVDVETFECTITDNGIGSADYPKNGLGSALFDAVAPGNWSLETSPDGVGTQLRLLISAPSIPSIGDY